MNDLLEISGLSLAEYYSIESAVGKGNLSRKRSDNTSLKHGVLDPITATVLVSLASIQALSLWLSKNRKEIKIEQTETAQAEDGSTKTVKKSVTINCETTDPEIAKQISKFAGLDFGNQISE